MGGVKMSQSCRATSRTLFILKSPEISYTLLTDLGIMKVLVDLETTQWGIQRPNTTLKYNTSDACKFTMPILILGSSK